MPSIGMFGSRLIVGPMLMITIVLPIVVYLVARLKSTQDDAPDPQVGFKVVVCWFRTIAFQALLFGGCILAYALIGDFTPELGGYEADWGEEVSSQRSQLARIGAGFFVPAGFLYLVLYVALAETNWRENPAVYRMFRGVSLVYSGLVEFTTLSIGGVLLFQKSSASSDGELVLSAIIVFGIASLVQGVRLLRDVSDR